MLADAPWDMMRDLYGMGARNYSATRSWLGVKSGVGRPTLLKEKNELWLWGQLPESFKENPLRPPDPEWFLHIHRERGLPLRSVWAYTRQYLREQKSRETDSSP